jgi:hypothetical protein
VASASSITDASIASIDSNDAAALSADIWMTGQIALIDFSDTVGVVADMTTSGSITAIESSDTTQIDLGVGQVAATGYPLDGASTYVSPIKRRFATAHASAVIGATVTASMTARPFAKRLGKAEVEQTLEAVCSGSLAHPPFSRTLRLVKCEPRIETVITARATTFDRDLQDFYLLLEAA